MRPLRRLAFRNARRQQFSLVLSLGFAFATSCTSLHAPVAPPSFNAKSLLAVRNFGIQLQAVPIHGSDRYNELFDDDLPAIGILALWISLKNEAGSAIDLSSATFRLRAGERTYHALELNQLFKIYYKRRYIRLYTFETDETARRDVAQVCFKRGIIPPQKSAEGLIFFSVAPPVAAKWPEGSLLVIKRIPLPEGRERQLELSLAYAHP